MKKFPPKKQEIEVFKKPIKHEFSIYQKRIFKDINSGIGHTIVEAYAGSGKTYSLVEAIKYVPKGKKVLCLAFNKDIAKELKSRVSDVHEVATFHSIGFRAIKQRFGKVDIDQFKMKNILSKMVDEKELDLIDNLCQTICYCKYTLVDVPSKIEKIIVNYGVDLCGLELKEFISIVVRALSENKKQTNIIDFDDMCLFPYLFNLNLGKFDFVMCDEHQDCNASQLTMALKAVGNNGRIIAFGDKFQACYSWRGADNTIIQRLIDSPNAKILSLPISYRCPTKVLDLCRLWVKNIEAKPNAPEGNVEDISLNQLYDKAKPGSFILSRTNAPLIKICMNFVRRGVKANIKGRDIGNQLTYLIKKSKKKDIPSFLKWLDAWKDEQLKFLQEKKMNTENLMDRYECVLTVAEESKNIKEMISKIDSLFNDVDGKNVITLSSVHRSKGKETDDVFVLRWSHRIWLDNLTHLIEFPNEESNLAYIAASRSRKNLYIVHKIFDQEIP